MFGYVIANLETLDEIQQQRYRACYCGLCHAIRQEYSSLARLSLNYDMTFLVLLLNSLYEPEEADGIARCVAHPFQPRNYWLSRCTRYCAAMNVALAYYNCMDDWQDDRKVSGLLEAQLFRTAKQKITAAYPRQTSSITEALLALNSLERSGRPDPDGAANSFGRLMGEIFVMDESDYWAPTLRTVGEGLGRYIYLLDAVIDLEHDLRRGRYNPLSELARSGRKTVDFQDDLTLLIGECAAAFEQLPLVQDAELLRNILYSGLWIKFYQALDKQTGANGKGGPS